MQPDDDVVVVVVAAASAAEMQMHSLLLQQQQQKQRQQQQQVNCTIFNAKVKSANGKKSLAKFYAGSCHYLLHSSLESHVARLYFGRRFL